MRQARFRSLIRHLFTEHHVYVRSGAAGRYVVTSWPWQLGVTLALAGIVVWAGAASYGWVATHLAAIEQNRELARLAEQLLPASMEIAASVSGRDWLYDRITRGE